MNDRSFVGGLPVPGRLIGLIRAGKWEPPSDDVLRSVFGHEPEEPLFYDEDGLVQENRTWQNYPGIAWPGDPADKDNLGIVAERSMVIADLGRDLPVVLDYRESPTSPRVIYMKSTAWVQIAASFGDLVDLLYPQEDV
ncbi:hypothetical protein [Streptomyces sp. NPDC060366]|uniref:hypothetical protein n=1 Tax=Streptomyces sp. NPDC060366 TaxID=3347105 RepID=UPI00364CA4A7